MVQTARPDSDVSLDGWTNPSFSAIDEVVADDADFTQSPLAPATRILEVGLSNVTDPASSVDHILRYRYQKDQDGGGTINLVVRLMQGATEIAAYTHNGIATGFLTATQTLTAVQADAITDYTDLRLRFEATQP